MGRLTGLFRNLAIYGVGDAATSLVSLLLLPIFTSYLTPADYGVITMLLTIEAVAKLTFRWGVDTAFMRLYFDCRDQAARQRLASTLFWFLLGVNGILVLIAALSAGRLSDWILGSAGAGFLVALTILNTYVAGFYFIPYQVLRINNQSYSFIALTFTRAFGTIIARLIFVIGAGMGVVGIVTADLAVTGLFTLLLTRWFAPLVRPVFSAAVLKDALSFGLPRIPHSLAQQVLSFADRYFLNAFGTLADVGLYSIGATFGLALKYFLGAFESAWTPFFLGVMHEPEARRVYSTASTYIVAALVLLVSMLTVVSGDVVRLFTADEFHAAAIVTPWIALGVMFQGLYLVGSIGLIITKRTARYPLSTGAAAAVSVAANAVLVPRFGMLGAAYANVLAYATLAVMTSTLSWQVYPIPYEWGRLARVALAGIAGTFVTLAAVPEEWLAPVTSILARASLAVAVYALVLGVTGFFHAGEIRFLADVRRRVLRRGIPVRPTASADDVEMAGEVVAPAPDLRVAAEGSVSPQASDTRPIRDGESERT